MPRHHRPRHERRRTSSSLRFVDHAALERILEPLLPDPADRAFVIRCVLDEGPIHHRGANYVLLMLLAKLAAPVTPVPGRTASITMHLPPHLLEEADDDPGAHAYPIRLPLEPLEALAGGDAVAVEAMVDCLGDGPPQHALANALMVALIDAALRARGGG